MAGPIDFDFTLGPLFGIIVIVALAVLVFDIWMLVDAIQRPPELYPSPDQKTLWVVGLIVGLATGLPATAVAIAYFIIVRKPAAQRAAAYPPAGPPPGTPASPPGAPAPPPVPPFAPAPINCRNCGAKLNAGARFCHSCGTPVA